MADDRRLFAGWLRVLDGLFWVIWLVLPITIWTVMGYVSDPGTALSGLSPEQARCVASLPKLSTMSPFGRAVFWWHFAFQFSIYFVLLACLHRMVSRFARGQIFVADTLAGLQFMGSTLVIWPFLDCAATFLAARLLTSNNEPGVIHPMVLIDPGPLTVGVFLIAMKFVIQHAIAVKSENDLTI